MYLNPTIRLGRRLTLGQIVTILIFGPTIAAYMYLAGAYAHLSYYDELYRTRLHEILDLIQSSQEVIVSDITSRPLPYAGRISIVNSISIVERTNYYAKGKLIAVDHLADLSRLFRRDLFDKGIKRIEIQYAKNGTIRSIRCFGETELEDTDCTTAVILPFPLAIMGPY